MWMSVEDIVGKNGGSHDQALTLRCSQYLSGMIVLWLCFSYDDRIVCWRYIKYEMVWWCGMCERGMDIIEMRYVHLEWT